MIKNVLGILFLSTCLIFTAIPFASGAQTITLSSTSSAHAETIINSAISSVASDATESNPGYINLTSGTYQISSPIILKSNVILKGEGNDTIIYAGSSVCNSPEAPAYVYGSGVSNAEVSNLHFRSSATGTGEGGHGNYRNCIKLSSVVNCTVHDCLFQNYLYGDGVRVTKSSGVQIYNCSIRSGHDGIAFLSKSSDCRAYNNDIDIRVNTGIRADNSENIEIDNNTFYGLNNSGWCCTEMEGNLSGIKIHNNIFHDYQGSSGNAAVQPVHASGTVLVYNNVLWKVGGIKYGTTSKNIINPSNTTVANWVAKGYGSNLSENL
jgi:hypothetical protein